MTASSLRDLYRQQREAIAAEIQATTPDGRPLYTLDEIAKRRGISRERVRQIGATFGIARRTKRPS